MVDPEVISTVQESELAISEALVLGEGADFVDIPLYLQILATVIGLLFCVYEATHQGRAKKRDNKTRFEEYKKRYKYE